MDLVRTFQNIKIIAGKPHENIQVLRDLASQLPGKRILLLAGAHVMADGERRVHIMNDAFKGRIVESEVVPPFPSRARVERMINLARDLRADGVLGIGGGSVMDTAKTVAVLAPNPMTLDDAMCGRWALSQGRLHLAVVPTLFGSGSEVTPFSVLFADGKKYSLDHPWFQPDFAAIIPRWGLLPSANPAAAAYLDALAQSIESLWSVRSTPESDRYAWRCLKRLMDFRAAVTVGVRYDLLARASVDGGCAIGITRTTLAHAMSYPLTIHHDVPHGTACAVFLPAVLLWNAAVGDQASATCTHPNGPAFVEQRITEISTWLCGKEAGPREGAAEIVQIAREVGIKLSLRQLGIPAESHADIAARVGNPERLGNNPRRVTPEALNEIIAASAEPKD